VARWYRSAGKPLLKIVIVKVPRGELSLRVFFCTDSSRTARQVIEAYGSRWGMRARSRGLGGPAPSSRPVAPAHFSASAESRMSYGSPLVKNGESRV
jgi:hypothetical protein